MPEQQATPNPIETAQAEAGRLIATCGEVQRQIGALFAQTEHSVAPEKRRLIEVAEGKLRVAAANLRQFQQTV